MADQEFKSLLVKLGIGTKDWNTAVRNIRKQLGDLYEDEKKKYAETQKQNAAAAVAVKQQLADEKKIQAEIQKRKDLEAQVAKTVKDISASITRLTTQEQLHTKSVKETEQARKAVLQTIGLELRSLIHKKELSTGELSALKSLTAEYQKQKVILEAPSKKTVMTPTGATVMASAESSAAMNAAAELRLRLAQQERFTTAQIVTERQKILMATDKEIAALRLKTTMTAEERSQLSRLVSLREQQVRALTQAEIQQKRITLEDERQVRLKAQEVTRQARTVAPEYVQSQAKMRAALAQGEKVSRSQVRAIEGQILATLDAQINALRKKEVLNKEEVATLNRLSAQRARQSASAGGRGGGFLGAGTVGGRGDTGFVGGLLSGFTSRLAGTIGFAVLSAEGIGRMLASFARSVKEVIEQSGQIEHLRDTFQRLGAIKGVDTVKFLEQLRQATYNLVPDIQLMKMANVAMQSGLKVSTDQIAQMTHATVALAMAQGNNASVAMQALNRSFTTGRFMLLGYVTGIQRAELQMQSYGGRTLPSVVQRQQQFNTMLDTLNRKLLLVGEPTLTITDRLKILGNEWERVREKFAHELVKSEGFRNFLVLIDGFIGKLRNMEEGGSGFANFLGTVFESITVFAKTLGHFSVQLGGIFKPVVIALSEVITGSSNAREIVLSLAQAFALLAEGMVDVAADTAFAAREIIAFADVSKSPEKAGKEMLQAFKDWKQQLKEAHVLSSQIVDEIQNIKAPSFMTGFSAAKKFDKEHPLGGLPGEPGPPPDPAFAIRMAKLEKQFKQAQAKEELENAKAALQLEKDANEEAYSSNQKTFADYIHAKIELRKQDLQATLTELKQTHDAQVVEAGFEERLATAGLEKQKTVAKAEVSTAKTPEEKIAAQARLAELESEVTLAKSSYEWQKKTAKAQYDAQTQRAQTGALGQQQQLADQLLKDQVQAARTRAEEEVKIEQQSVTEQKTLLEDQFKDGLIAVSAYMAKRKDLVQADLELTVSLENEKYDMSNKSLEALAKKDLAITSARGKAHQELTKLDLSEDELRLKSIESSYGRIQKILQDQIKFAAPGEQGGLGGKDLQIGYLNQLMSLNSRYLRQLDAELEKTDQQSNRWFQIKQKIAEASLEQIKFNEELIKAQDTLSPIAAVFGAAGSAISGINKKVGGAISAAAHQLDATAKVLNEIKTRATTAAIGRQAKPLTPAEIFAALQKTSDTTSSKVLTLGEAAHQAAIHLAEIGKLSTTAIPEPAPGTEAPEKVSGTFQHGGYVPTTQMALVHAGETVVPPGGMTGVFSAIFHSLKTVVDGLVPSFERLGSTVDKATDKMFRPVIAASSAPTPTTEMIPTTAPPPAPVGGFASRPDIFKVFSDANGPFQTMVAGLGKAATLLGGPFNVAATAAAAAMGGIVQGVTGLNVGISGQKLGPPQMGVGGLLGVTPGAGLAKNATAIFGNAAQLVGAGIGSLSSIVNPGPVGALAGAFSGLQGGAGLGSAVGQTVGAVGTSIGGAVGGALSSAAPYIGPIVAALGAIVGAILGSMAKTTEKLAQGLQADFTGLTTTYQAGEMTLAAAITGATASRNEMIAKLADQFGGSQYSNQLQVQEQQAITQMEGQQRQIFQAFEKNLQMLRVPDAFHNILDGMQSIFQSYQQYVDAGGDVAKANEMLQASFAQLRSGELDQLNSAYQQAINDSLQYQQQQLQSQQLAIDTSVAIQNIMNQGVAIRQTPEAVTKYLEIQKVQAQANIQRDQLNQQMAVTKHRLDAENQIFNLATSRVDLETQLVILQDAQIDKSMSQVQALAQVYTMLSGTTPTSMIGAIADLGMGATAAGLPNLPNISQVNPGGKLANPIYYSTSQPYITTPGRNLTAEFLYVVTQINKGNFDLQNGLAQLQNVYSQLSSADLAASGPNMQNAISMVQQEIAQQQAQAMAIALQNQAAPPLTQPGTGVPVLTGLPAPVLTLTGQNITPGQLPSPTLPYTPGYPPAPTNPLAPPPPAPVGPGPGTPPVLEGVVATTPNFITGTQYQTGATDLVASATIPTSITGLAPSIVTPSTSSSAAQYLDIAQQRLSMEQQIMTVAQQRLSIETQIAQIHGHLLSALSNAADSITSKTNAGATGGDRIETLFQQLYQERGRMGVNGFYGELSSAS